jgi:Ca2+-binding RTX toxin-like protein
MASFPGTSGPDDVTGTAEADQISGEAGNDNLYGEDGDDVIDGGADSDYVDGGYGSDLLHGGEGDDSLRDGNDSSSTGSGNDQLFGDGGDDDLFVYLTTNLPDTLLLDGGEGNDRVSFSAWYDVQDVTMLGGGGNDMIQMDGGASFDVDAGAGNDRIDLIYSGYATDYRFTLGAGQDVLTVRLSSLGSVVPIHVTDLQPGAAGDRIVIDNYLVALTGWDRIGNPFASGHLALVQSGADAVLRIDHDGGGNGYQDFVVFEGVSAAAITAYNIGFAPDGGATPPLPQDGGAAGDFILGGGGAELLRGFGGDDEIFGGAGNDRIEGGPGNDQLDGGFGHDVVLGEGGDDRVTDGYGGNDRLYGGDGNDFIAIERGRQPASTSVYLDGGAGNDELRFWGVGRIDAVTFVAGAGDDYISTNGARIAMINAGDGNDILYIGNSGTAYTITLGGGVDRIDLDSGHVAGGQILVKDFATGAGGDQLGLDSYLRQALTGWDPRTNPYETGFLQIIQRGADSVLQMDRDAAGSAASFTDLIVFANTTAASFTTLNLGGYSSIVGTEAIDLLEGDSGNNSIYGFGDADKLIGNDGDDTLYGGAGADELDGGGGKDKLDGGAGADRMTGGGGADIYLVDDAADQVIEGADFFYLPYVADEVWTALASYTIPANVELLVGTSTTGQTLTGSENDEIIRGGDGNDHIYLLGGSNMAAGGAGDDWIEGGDGQDSITGGTGSDRIYGGDGDDFLGGTQRGVNDTGDDYLEGGAGNDYLGGSWGDDVLLGGSGNDSFEDDGTGTDLLDGGEGDDYFLLARFEAAPAATATLLGGAGNDSFDLILRNAGTVELDAGAGDDHFLFYSHSGTTKLTLGAGIDTIAFSDYYPTEPKGTIAVADFATGASGDRLDLNAFLEAWLVNWDKLANPFASGHLRLVQNGISALLQMDRDGGGDGFATLFTFASGNADSFTPENLGGYDHLRIFGSDGDDLFRLDDAGPDAVAGGSGNDTFLFGAAMTGADTVDGGAGSDQVTLRGNYSGANALALQPATMTNIERLVLVSGRNTASGPAIGAVSYNVTASDANVATGQGFTVNAGGLGADERFLFSGRFETDGYFVLIGGAGSDVIVGGRKSDTIVGGPGNDSIQGGFGGDSVAGGGGVDTFIYGSAYESSGLLYDKLIDFNSGEDRLNLHSTVSGWAGPVTHGSLTNARFSADLAAALDPALGANQAVLFTPDSGDLAGKTFLVVDGNGDGAYQPNLDYVFLVGAAAALDTSSTAWFL